MTNLRVSAACHSDDHRVEIASFDATPWFEQAADEEIITLAEAGFCCDYSADRVAVFAADLDPRVHDLFGYLALVNGEHRGDRDPVGFACYVCEQEAIAWIKQKRPYLLEKL